MISLADVRARFPMYDDVDDETLLRGVHSRFYGDMPYESFRSQIGGARPQQAARTAESVGRNWLERTVLDPAERGFQNVATGITEIRGANPNAFYGLSEDEAGARIARRQRRLDEIPQTQASQEAFRRAQEAGGVLGAVGEIAGSRSAVGDIVGESIGANPVAGAVGVAANVTPVPVLRQALGALAGALGFPTEFASSRGQALLEAAKDAGIDPRDPQALGGLIREINADPERRDEIRRDALTRAGIISTVDAAAGYGAGRLATRSAAPRIAGAAAIEGVGGGVGEAAAGLATEGRINPVEVAAEIVGGGAMGAAGNLTRAVDPQLAARSQRAAEDEELARALRERAETEEPERPTLQLGTDIPSRIETPYGVMTPTQLMEFAEANVEAFPALQGVLDMPAGETAGLRGGETGRFTEGDRIQLISNILNNQPDALGAASQQGESADALAVRGEINRLDQQIAAATKPARIAELTAKRSAAVNRLGEIAQRDSTIVPRDPASETRRVLNSLEPEDRALIERFFPDPSTFALQKPEVQSQFLEVARKRANRESNAMRQIRDEIAQLDQQIARNKQPILAARLREARAAAVQRLGEVSQREVEGFRAAIEQAPRMAADADRQIGEIAQRIGEDPVALVTSTLPVTEVDFRRAAPEARERLVARAQQLRTTQTPGRSLRTSFDASAAEGEASPPSRPNAPAFASVAQGQFEDDLRSISPTATELEAQAPPTAAQIRQANNNQQRSERLGYRLDVLRGERSRALAEDGRLNELRRAEATGTITPREQQELDRLEADLRTLNARINAAMLRVYELSRSAGFGSQSASGTSDRPFAGFEEGREAEASPGLGPDPLPGETQAQYLERQARERAQREQDAIRDRILREQEARARAREEAARDKADADRANAKERDTAKSPGKPDANGFYSVDEDGFLLNGEKLVVFGSKPVAARWMASNRQAAYWDLVVRRANSDEVMLRARPAYYADKSAAEADARAEQPGQSEAPRSIGGRQFSALNTDQQSASEAAPEATPEADRAERRARANAIIDARLERLKAMGKQGRLARNAVIAALKDRRFTPEQMLAAFRIAEAFTRVVGGGRAVRVEFRQNLEDMRDQAGGVEPQALVEAIKNGPNGVEAVARFSLSDSNLPVANMTAPHEAFHVLQALFKGSEPKLAQILDRAFPAGKGIDGIDPTILRKLKTLRPAGSNQSYYDFLKRAISNEDRPAELQAYVFGALMDAQMRGEPMSGMTPAITRLVNYFAQMKRQVGALLRGDGVTAAGIMERAARGEYAGLDRVQDTAGAQASALKPPQDTTKEEGQARSFAEYFRSRAATSRARGNEEEAAREEALAAREEQRANDLKSARENRTPEIPPLPASALRKADEFYARGGNPYAPLQPLLGDVKISPMQYERMASEIYGGEPGSWPSDRRIQRAREAGDEDKVQRSYRMTGAHWLQQYLANRMNADVLERARQIAQQERGDPDMYVGYLSRARAQVESMHQASPATSPGRETRSIPSLVGDITAKLNDLTNSVLSEDMRTQKEEGIVSLDLARRMKDRGIQFSAMQINTPEFKRWFGDSKIVDRDGKPLVLYRGLRGESFLQGVQTMEPREGYATFFSDSPYVASTYANPDTSLPFPDDAGAVFPVYVAADKLIEFPARRDAQGNTSFDFFEFDRRARALRPGEALVARGVRDIGPRASTVADPERRYSYGSDIYAIGRGTQAKSATGNRGAFDASDPRIQFSAMDLSSAKQRKDVTSRDPVLTEAAQGVRDGTVTRDQYEALVNERRPVLPYEFVPAPATEEEMRAALKENQQGDVGRASATLEKGHPVGLRLDIPAYTNADTWVVTVHQQEGGFTPGKKIGYESVAAVTGPVTMGVLETSALKIASGSNKGTIAVVKGNWDPITPKEAVRRAVAAMDDPAWVQVGMDPYRHSYFYDRRTMEPVVGADEAIQIGPLVLAKNPVYGKKSDYQFSAMNPAALRQFSAANPSTPLAGNRAWVNATSGMTKGAPPSTLKRAILGGIFGALPGEVDQAQTFSEGLEVAKRAFKRNTVNIAASVEKLDQALAAKGIPTVRKLSQLVEEARMNTGRMELISEVGGLGYDPAKQTIVFDKNVPSMLKALQNRVSDRDIGEFQKYLIARRESDLRKAGRKGLSKKADAEIQAAIRLAEQQHPEWRDAAADIQKINKAMLDIAVKTGTLDAARAKQLAGMMYTPFYRYAEEDATGQDQADVIGPKLSQTLSNPAAFEKAVHDGGEIGDNLIANMLRNYDAILRSAMKNVAAREVASNLAKLTDANGNPLAERIKGSRKTGDQNVVITKENGQDVLYKIHAPDIYLAMTGLPKAQRGAIFDSMARIAGWFRVGITSAPSYVWANLIRGRVVAYAQEGLPLFSNVYRGAKEFYNASTSLTDFQAQTGFGGFTFGMGDDDPGAGFMRALRAANGERRPKDLFFNLIDGLQKFSEASEMADRLLLVEHLTKKGIDPREARFQAYLLAPYSRHGLGEGGIGQMMQFLTPLVPFLNSKVQSMNRMMENDKGQRMIRTPLGFKMPADRFIRSLLITGFSVGAYALAQATAPDEWEQENPDTILRYDIFYVGGQRILIPRAFEFGVAFGALPIFALEAIRKGNGDDMARAVAQTFVSTYGFSIIPQAVVPLLEVATGYNFFQGRPLENRGQQALPAEERVNEGTSSLARVVSQGVMGAQRAALPPNMRLDLSPIEVQRLVEGYTGTLGIMLLNAFDSVLAGSGALPERPASSFFGDPNAFFGLQGAAAEVSGLKRFIRGQDEQVTRGVGDFYRMKGDLDQLVRSATLARDSNDIERFADIMSENGMAFGARNQLNRIGDQIGKLNRQIEMIRRQGGDAEDMRERLALLREQRNTLADRGADLARAVGLR